MLAIREKSALQKADFSC